MAAPEETFRSSGTTNLMHRTWTSRQEGKSWAGMVKAFRPREYSWPLSSTSVRMAAQGHPLAGADVFEGDVQLDDPALGLQIYVPRVHHHGVGAASTDKSTGVGAALGGRRPRRRIP